MADYQIRYSVFQILTEAISIDLFVIVTIVTMYIVSTL